MFKFLRNPAVRIDNKAFFKQPLAKLSVYFESNLRNPPKIQFTMYGTLCLFRGFEFYRWFEFNQMNVNNLVLQNDRQSHQIRLAILLLQHHVYT